MWLSCLPLLVMVSFQYLREWSFVYIHRKHDCVASVSAVTWSERLGLQLSPLWNLLCQRYWTFHWTTLPSLFETLGFKLHQFDFFFIWDNGLFTDPVIHSPVKYLAFCYTPLKSILEILGFLLHQMGPFGCWIFYWFSLKSSYEILGFLLP